MWTDINNIHTLYEDNVVVHNRHAAVSAMRSAIRRSSATTLSSEMGPMIRAVGGWGNEIQIQNSQNVEVYGNRVEMTGGGNGIVMIQQNRGSGTFGTYTTTGNQIHDNIIVDHDGEGYIGGVADYNQSGMLNGGNTWSNNQYFMSDGGGRFEWGGSETFTQFKDAAHETGSISQSYPDTSGWLTASPADATPSPPADPAPPPPADTSPPSTPGVNTTIGSGSDSLELKITQDAYQGDSQYAIYVDGKQIGATLTASALHGSGEADSLQVKGDWAAGSHTVSVTLLNDLWGGTTGTDRNIYVESATFDGAPVPGSKLAIYDGTPKSFTVTDTTAVPPAVAPLLAASGGVQASTPNAGEMHLTQGQLDSVVAAAIAQWAAAGASASQLAALPATTFSVADLSGNTIGKEGAPSHITIDVDAAGHGWFVDPTPSDNFEFTHALNAVGTDLLTDPTSAAAGHLDLLTTVSHEMGHVINLPDSTATSDAHDLMYINLVDGERRLPSAADVAQANAATFSSHTVGATAPPAPGSAPQASASQPATSDGGHFGWGADTFVFAPSGAATPMLGFAGFANFIKAAGVDFSTRAVSMLRLSTM